MATDPNLSSDGCIFMERGSPNWWSSNDVKLTGTGVATLGVKNNVEVTVRRRARGCQGPDPTFVRVDLFVCNPTGSPFTTSSPYVKKILDACTAPPSDIEVDPPPPFGDQVTKTVKWDLPTTPTHLAEQPGHKCLIARAYPNTIFSGGPDLSNYTSDPEPDPHYAQRNICIQTCSSPCGIDVWAENEKRELPRDVTFRVAADLNPNEQVLAVALPLLRQVPGFKRVVPAAPRRGFSLEFPDFPKATMVDNTRPGCLSILRGFGKSPGPGFTGSPPTFEAQIKLDPGQFTIYRFMTDLDGSDVGDAHIFQLMHLEGGRVLNGLTMAMVKV